MSKLSGKKKIIIYSIIGAAVVAVIGLTLFLALNGKKKEPECIYGVCEYYSTYSNEIIKDSYRYSDDWFSEKPSVQNDELALLSMQLTASVVNDDDSGSGVRFLTDLGFDQTGFVGFDKDDPYNISFMWGKKEIDGQTVMAVVLQSYSLDSGVKELAWKQNFTVNGPEAGSEFYSYSLGADRMVESVTGIAGSGNVKYWIMGQSRGGAYSNVLAARLLDQAGVSAKRIYAYTFEAPNTVEQSAVPDNESRYDFIHNYICDDDIVTAVPMWGMTRYGVTHLLNTPENEAALPGELLLTGSPVYGETQSTGYGTYGKPFVDKIINRFTEVIPDRASYSEDHSVQITKASGETVTVSYNYQDMFTKLMGTIFKEQEEEDPEMGTRGAADVVLDNMPSLYDVISDAYYGCINDDDARYLSAADSICSIMAPEGIELPFNRDEIYALLKLAGPLLIDTSVEMPAEGLDEYNYSSFVAPALKLFVEAKTFTLSHQFDTTIARLRILAGNEKIPSMDIPVTFPAAGDPVSLLPDSLNASEIISSSADAGGRKWMTADANWATDDTELKDNKVYYLNLSLKIAGHRFEDGFDLTLGGQRSMEPVEVRYEDGFFIASGTWRFVIGQPAEVSVSCDTAGYGEAPDPVTVPEGTVLKYEMDAPIPDDSVSDDITYRFTEWTDGSGRTWEEVTASGDTVLTAGWESLISNVSVDFVLPQAGGVMEQPVIPGDALYRFSSLMLMDESYNEVDTVESGKTYWLSIELSIPEGCGVIYDPEDEYRNYTGSYTINGEVMESDYEGTMNASYNEDDSRITIDYKFTVE